MGEEEFEVLQNLLNDFFEQENLQPVEEIDNLSPLDMQNILYYTFDETSPIKLNRIYNNHLFVKRIPFLELTLNYLNKISDLSEIKLTAKGNLPKNICLELYDLGIIKEEAIESGVVKLNREGDSSVLQNLKLINLQSGLTKKRNGYLSLTAKGEKLLQNPFEIFEAIFMAYAYKFNWAYHDGFEEEGGIQSTFGFLIYLLLRYGQEERETLFYSQKHAIAFPFLFDEISIAHSFGTPDECYDTIIRIRFFERFLQWFGLINIRLEGEKHKRKYYLRISDVFEDLFKLDQSRFMFNKPNNFA